VHGNLKSIVTAQTLRIFRTVFCTIEKVYLSDLRAKTYGDTAIVAYQPEMSGLHKGAKFSQKASVTGVWKKEGERWQLGAFLKQEKLGKPDTLTDKKIASCHYYK
jgi:hypothetical protein